MALAFEWIDGREPVQPWAGPELDRVMTALGRLSRTDAVPAVLPIDHPRLGRWPEIALALKPIFEEKLRLGRAAVNWLERRLDA